MMAYAAAREILDSEEYANDPLGVTEAIVAKAVRSHSDGDHDAAREWAAVANLVIGPRETRDATLAARGDVLNAINAAYSKP
jgi:hypothetical protein